ncbi:MAG: PQQ-binding-like beta-propeller repeat protein [Verrucomicrobiota bacterium]
MHHLKLSKLLLAFLVLVLNLTLNPNLSSSVAASDWPQFLGPNRDGVYPVAENGTGTDLAREWPVNGPPQLWNRKTGQGFSGPVVADGKLILFHRLGNDEVVDCLEAMSGKTLWTFKYPTSYVDSIVGEDHGPRATPAMAHGSVFTFGAEGLLHCLNQKSGQVLWSVDCAARFGADKGFFGFACSPLVEGNAVLLNIGGRKGAGIVAFDRASGKLLWQSTDHEASYSSPVSATIDNERRVFFFTREGLVGLDPSSGKVHFEHPWRARLQASVNAAAPLVVGNLVFISASYGTGAALLRVHRGQVEKVWSGDDILSNHFATAVHHDGFLYGFDGRHEYGPRLRCIELKTGKVRWTKEGIGAGCLLRAGNDLLVLLESGQLLRVAAQPGAYQELARAQILGGGTRAHPALAYGLLYARSRDKLVCVDLRAR